jgi:hypothetical protein
LSDRGSLSILLAGYLALAVLIFVGLGATGLSLLSQNRVQAVADSAVLFAHDRAVKKGIPNSAKLQQNLGVFLTSAPSAQQLNIRSIEIAAVGLESRLRLCANYKDPIGLAAIWGEICKSASAKSFLVD